MLSNQTMGKAMNCLGFDAFASGAETQLRAGPQLIGRFHRVGECQDAECIVSRFREYARDAVHHDLCLSTPGARAQNDRCGSGLDKLSLAIT